jgi:hypothetical protein
VCDITVVSDATITAYFVSVPTSLPPPPGETDPVSAFSATHVGSAVELRWTKGADNDADTVYEVIRSTNGGSWEGVYYSTGIAHDDFGAQAGENRYQIVATNSGSTTSVHRSATADIQ